MFNDIAPTHRARKRFGQNFLTDQRIIDRIIDSIGLQTSDTVVEIGPGRGALTQGLISSGAMLHLVELDRDLGAEWLQRANERLSVTITDALRFDLQSIAPEHGKLRVVGNLPYNISSPLLFHLLGAKSVIQDMHFMLQREVVQRLAAEPGGSDYGRLSVMMQYHCFVEHLFDVPPSAFSPAPKVVSAIVRLIPRAHEGTSLECSKTLDLVVKQAFSQRRKTLRNALGKLINAEQLDALGIDPSRRAETISVDEYVKVANAVQALRDA